MWRRPSSSCARRAIRSRFLVAGVPRVPGSEEPVPRQAGARSREPGRRSAGHEPGGGGGSGQADGQLDQRRRSVRHRVAGIPTQCGEGQAAPARGGLSDLGSWWLEFPGFQDPKNPFRDKRVREAVSLAVDRRAMNQAEAGGLGKPTGNWINDDVQYAIEWPEFPRNVEKAKQLLREAGYP